MATEDRITQALLEICTKDGAGRHFTEVWGDVWGVLEKRGWLAVHRPVHEGTGIPFAEEYWSCEVTEAGLEVVRRVEKQLADRRMGRIPAGPCPRCGERPGGLRARNEPGCSLRLVGEDETGNPVYGCRALYCLPCNACEHAWCRECAGLLVLDA